MLKKLMMIAMVAVMSVSGAMAQDFSKLSQADLDKVASDLSGWLNSGTGGLMYVSAKAPTTFGFRVGLFAVAAPFPEMPDVESSGYLPNNAGLLVSVGTLGFEATARFLPVDQLNVFGVGLKYELTKLIPLPPGIPVSLAAYADYNKFSVKDADTELTTSNMSFGALASFDLFIKVYGRLGYEIGGTTVNYVYKMSEDGYPGAPDVPIGMDIDSNGIRAAAGLSLMMFDFEVGYRSNTYAAAGVSFGF